MEWTVRRAVGGGGGDTQLLKAWRRERRGGRHSTLSPLTIRLPPGWDYQQPGICPNCQMAFAGMTQQFKRSIGVYYRSSTGRYEILKRVINDRKRDR